MCGPSLPRIVAFQLARNQQGRPQKGSTPQFRTPDSPKALLRRRVKPTAGNGRYAQNPSSVGMTNIFEDDNGTKLRFKEMKVMSGTLALHSPTIATENGPETCEALRDLKASRAQMIAPSRSLTNLGKSYHHPRHRKPARLQPPVRPQARAPPTSVT